jgi:hypothetical protein
MRPALAGLFRPPSAAATGQFLKIGFCVEGGAPRYCSTIKTTQYHPEVKEKTIAPYFE